MSFSIHFNKACKNQNSMPGVPNTFLTRNNKLLNPFFSYHKTVSLFPKSSLQTREIIFKILGLFKRISKEVTRHT